MKKRRGEERRGKKPRLILFVTNRWPSEERDLVLHGVDEVADYGEDEEEEDDDDGYDDVAFDHFFLIFFLGPPLSIFFVDWIVGRREGGGWNGIGIDVDE